MKNKILYFSTAPATGSRSKYFPEVISIDGFRDGNDIAKIEYKETDIEKKLDIIYSGTGLKSFLDMLIKIFVSKAKIVLIDEPERGLHPDQQRRLVEFLIELSDKEDIQFFISSHSPVFLNYPDRINYYRVFKHGSYRHVEHIGKEKLCSAVYDLGFRASDIFNSDMTVLVEGTLDLIYFDYVIRGLYSEEFKDVAINIQPYGGSSIVDGIRDGDIPVPNITGSQQNVLWIADRDVPEGQPIPEKQEDLKNVLQDNNTTCVILKKKEVEYYIPLELYQAHQKSNSEREEVKKAHADQVQKFRKSPLNFRRPNNTWIKENLSQYLSSKQQLSPDITELIENILIPWKNQILGIADNT